MDRQMESTQKMFFWGFIRKQPPLNWDLNMIALSYEDVTIPENSETETLYLNNDELSLLNVNNETKFLLKGNN